MLSVHFVLLKSRCCICFGSFHEFFIFSGVWNVPYVSACYLINGTLIRQPETKPSYSYYQLDADMAFCSNMRSKVSNFVCRYRMLKSRQV